MSRTGEQSSTPRAVIHKRILDAAESKPTASMGEIATEIGGASTDLVERVFDQYGDPGTEPDVPDADHERADREDVPDPDGRDEGRPHGEEGGLTEPSGAGGSTGPDSADGTTGPDSADGTTGPDGEDGRSESEGHDTDTHDHRNETGASTSTRDASEREGEMKENGRADADYPGLSEGQLRALRLIDRNPSATQGEIAEEFDVTRATISRWLSDIPGFEWSRRDELTPRILNGDPIEGADERAVADESRTDGPSTDESQTEGSSIDESVARERDVTGSEADEIGTQGGDHEPFAELDRRLERIERRLDRLDTGAATAARSTDAEARTPGIGPELAHKVVHACLRSDLLSEEDELQLLKELLS